MPLTSRLCLEFHSDIQQSLNLALEPLGHPGMPGAEHESWGADRKEWRGLWGSEDLAHPGQQARSKGAGLNHWDPWDCPALSPGPRGTALCLKVLS